MSVARGDIVTVAGAGGFAGKPRPALVVQADAFNATHGSVTLCLLTSELIAAPLFRVPITPSPENGLLEPSHVMVDKLVSAPRDRLGPRIGRASSEVLRRVDEALRTWLGL
ncbi:MAG: type II toxin-antitoxin system PemK/MazF family toxin [Myxococcales bacterium]|nr:type II toxin-antitoxin system PemK/MazF family toxin [Myxococcales bacterium]MCB9731270.1 type II toxin-antitoxin system PemK/MazF family toxin [Deltaproteobacteria bacterium]